MCIVIFLFLQINPQSPQLQGAKFYTYLGEMGELQMRVSIWGEVGSPGLYSVPEGTDLVTLLALSGGPKKEADISKIKIVRSFPEPKVFKANLKHFFKTGERDKVPVLKPGDMVYIKGTPYHSVKEVTHYIVEATMLVAVYYQIYQTFKWKVK